MNSIRLYCRSMGIQIRSRLQYPASFIMQTLAQLVMEGGEFLALMLIIDRFDRLNQWMPGDLFFFYGLMSVTFYLTECFARGITGSFPYMIRTGQLDTLLLRPRGVLTQVLCADADPRRISCIAVGLAAMVIGSLKAGVEWSFWKVLVLLESIGFGSLLIMGLFLIEASLVIHSVKSVELTNALTYGGRSACDYPIDIYPRPLRILFTVVAPFALVLHVPAAWILGKPLYGWPAWAAFLCPLAGAESFLIFYAVFRRSLVFYRSTGS